MTLPPVSLPLAPVLRWLAPWAARGRADALTASYRAAFAGRDDVLADLAVLCNAANVSFAAQDPTLTAFNEGKRAVWLHIQAMLALTPRDLADLKEVLDDDWSHDG